MIYQSHFQQNWVQLLKVCIFFAIFTCAKKQEIIEIERKTSPRGQQSRASGNEK